MEEEEVVVEVATTEEVTMEGVDIGCIRTVATFSNHVQHWSCVFQVCPMPYTMSWGWVGVCV